MLSSDNSTFDYQPDRIYTVREFEAINDWLKTHHLGISDIPIIHFELDSSGKLIPVSQTPVYIEGAVAEIGRQLGNWNIHSKQNGAITASQGGFNLTTAGGRTIRAPDIAFIPKETYRALTQEQLLSFQGQPFSPTFVVEVEDLTLESKLSVLTKKFKDEYFPAGIELGWLIDPVNKSIYTFKRTVSGSVRRHNHGWRDVTGRDVLPEFILDIMVMDNILSQSSSGSSDSEKIECPKCDLTFKSDNKFIKHYERDHALKKRKLH
ncbi:uncharacterized protein VTP21DRAFT_9782 [Calcarisporiella thermophila]|uniref:uncharacterized protein n=1 Tax=Calcarisporiella thermophila TaxID=911321 RepID=UPI0037446136